jgi:hypothetical protein
LWSGVADFAAGIASACLRLPGFGRSVFRLGLAIAIPPAGDYRRYSSYNEEERTGNQQPLPAQAAALLLAPFGSQGGGVLRLEGFSVSLSHPREGSW